jgi:hypothetical protein
LEEAHRLPGAVEVDMEVEVAVEGVDLDAVVDLEESRVSRLITPMFHLIMLL